MKLELDILYLLVIMLSSIRLISFMMLSPIIIFKLCPAQLTVLLSVAISTCLVISGVILIPHTTEPMSPSYIVSSIIIEVLVGVGFAAVIQVAFSIIGIAGRLIDMQAGLGAGSIFDPGSQSQQTTLSLLFVLTAGYIFFSDGIYETVIKGMIYSYQKMPVGVSVLNINPWIIIEFFGDALTYSLAIAVPVVATLFIFDFSTGLIARSMPQLNIYFLSLPLKICMMLLVLSISLPVIIPLMQNLMSKLAPQISQLMVTRT